MKNEILVLLEKYLQNDFSKSFSDLARDFKERNFSQKEVYDAFIEIYSERIVIDGKPAVSEFIESAYENALDIIWGWCGKSSRLWDTYLGDQAC